MQKKKTYILANAPIINGNRGCLALSYCAIYMIDYICKKNGIDYKLYLTDTQLKKTSEHTIQINNTTITFYTCNYPIAYTWKSLLISISKFRETLRSWRIFKNVDVVFDIGQGDSFSDIYGRKRFEMIDKIHKTARFFHKPYILLPQTIGPFSNHNIQKLANKTISKAKLVMSRDKTSFDYVNKQVKFQKSVYEYIDIAFFLPFKKKNFNPNYIHVGLNISALLWHGGYSKDNQFDLKSDYNIIIRQVLDYFLSIPNVTLHLVPHVVNHSRNIENDYAVSFDLQKEINNERVVLSPLFLSPIDAKDYISGLDFFVGSRMHSTIAAFSSGVPVVPISYSRKFNGLFIDTLGYEYLADMKQDSSERVLNMIKSVFEHRLQVKDIIKDRLDGIVEQKKRKFYKDLSEILISQI